MNNYITSDHKITAGGHDHCLTISSGREGDKLMGHRRKGFRTVEAGVFVPRYCAYCDQLPLLLTEGDSEDEAVEKMLSAARAVYDSLVKNRRG